MGFWSTAWDWTKKAGKGIWSGGKWLFNHSEEVSGAVDVGAKMYDGISERREQNRMNKNVNDRYVELNEKNKWIQEELNKINNKIYEIEMQNTEFADGLAGIKDNLNNCMQLIESEMQRIKEKQENDYNKVTRWLLLSNVAMGIAVVVAVLLAIFL